MGKIQNLMKIVFLFFISKIIRKHWLFYGFLMAFSLRSEPGLHRKKLKEGENEKGTSKGSVITPVLKKADSLTGGPLQKNDGSHFSEKDQHESR